MSGSAKIAVGWMVLAFAGMGPAARAQTSVAAPAPVTEATNGIKVGDGRLHAYFDFEARYDSAAGINSFQNGVLAQPFSEVVEHFRPGLRLEVPEDWVEFLLSGDVDYVLYPGLLTAHDGFASRVEAAANMSLAFNRTGPVELDLADTFLRSDRPRDISLGVGVLSLYNEARVAVPIHPGGGALEVTPRFAYALENFTPISSGTNGAGISTANYRNLEGGLSARYKFLPKTAVLVEAQLDHRTYPNSTGNPVATLLTADAGLAGLLTTRIAFIAKAGYAYDFGGSSASTVIGQLEGTYLLSETATLKAGLLRSVSGVSTYGTFVDTRPYLEARALLGGRLTLHGTVSYDILSFDQPKGQATPPRTDHVLTLDAGPEYQFAPWLIGAAGYVLGVRTSDVPTSTTQVLGYTRNEAYLRVTFTY